MNLLVGDDLSIVSANEKINELGKNNDKYFLAPIFANENLLRFGKMGAHGTNEGQNRRKMKRFDDLFCAR